MARQCRIISLLLLSLLFDFLSWNRINLFNNSIVNIFLPAMGGKGEHYINHLRGFDVIKATRKRPIEQKSHISGISKN